MFLTTADFVFVKPLDPLFPSSCHSFAYYSMLLSADNKWIAKQNNNLRLRLRLWEQRSIQFYLVCNATTTLQILATRSQASFTHNKSTGSGFYRRFSALILLRRTGGTKNRPTTILRLLPNIGNRYHPIPSYKKFPVYFRNSRLVPSLFSMIKIPT